MATSFLTLHLVIFDPKDYVKQQPGFGDTQMTLPRLIEKLKNVLLYEITPRRPGEPWSKRGPNISLSVRPKLGRDQRLSDNDFKYLTRDDHLL